MKARLTDWPTTVLGLGMLALLAYIVHTVPSLTDHPETLFLLAGGLWGVFAKRQNSTGEVGTKPESEQPTPK